LTFLFWFAISIPNHLKIQALENDWISMNMQKLLFRCKIYSQLMMEPPVNEKIMLGRSEIAISPLGMGIMQWGDIKLPQQSNQLEYDIVRKMFQDALDHGITFFDTAEMYGNGKSELHLHRCLEVMSDNIVIATKFMPFPWRLSKGELKSALKKSLKRLGIEQVDLYQMHWPFPPVPIPTWMEAMSDVVADGLIKAVGVSNYSPNQTRLAFDTLAKYNIPLASNQVKYNLLDRRPDKSGLVDMCKKLGVTIIAYSPLEKGLLTGKYNNENLPRGFLAWRYNKSVIAKIEPLFITIREIGDSHGGKTPAMVALNWLVCRGIVPIPGARNPSQVVDNAGALGWHLSDEEISKLDQLSKELT
jgi:aryl-alcohol dehydrogenase-like predicted oxidoreductase